jgi:hypothetical protein
MKLTRSETEPRAGDLSIAPFARPGLLDRLRRLRDRRGEQGTRQELAPLLLLMVFAKLAGEDTPSGIAEARTPPAERGRKSPTTPSRVPPARTARRPLCHPWCG